MAKNKALVTLGIIIGATVLVGVGLVGGKMMSSNNTQDSKENATQSLETANNGTQKPSEPEEKLVGKTGVCSTGEVKYIGSGNYVAGIDLASGEYVVENNPKNGETDMTMKYSMYVYTSKAGFESDRYMNKTAEVRGFSTTEKTNVKIDEGNYIEVKIGGKLTCQ